MTSKLQVLTFKFLIYVPHLIAHGISEQNLLSKCNNLEGVFVNANQQPKKL